MSLPATAETWFLLCPPRSTNPGQVAREVLEPTRVGVNDFPEWDTPTPSRARPLVEFLLRGREGGR
jgi:hypothetical protein